MKLVDGQTEQELMLAFIHGSSASSASYFHSNIRQSIVQYHPAVKVIMMSRQSQNTLFRDNMSEKRHTLNLYSTPNKLEKGRRYELPPFKVGDISALLLEVGLIFFSQLVIGLYTTLTAKDFPGWMTPVTPETLQAPTFYHSILVSFGLSFFWVLSRWWSRSLERSVYFYRLKDVFDATWQQWISVANLYIASSLIYSSLNHVGVTGIETPLVSGAFAILVARILYYGIPI